MAQLTIIGDEIQRGGSLALGNFDGLHRGHQVVFDPIRGNDNWAVCSFAPYPRRFFDPDSPQFELMNQTVQSRIVHQLGGRVHHIAFDQSTADLTPQQFLEAIKSQFEPTEIAIGRDFRFGHDRAGDAQFLQNWGAVQGVSTAIVDLVDDGSVKISSTEIRNALIAGRLDDATNMLGRPHIVNGIVAQGDQRGRDLGFPTANLYPDDVLLPKFGIYASCVTIHDGKHAGRYNGASSLGIRPSFGVNKPNFETFILDFVGDIYGSEISVELIGYVRNEEKFDDINALVTQMNADVSNIRAMLDVMPSHA